MTLTYAEMCDLRALIAAAVERNGEWMISLYASGAGHRSADALQQGEATRAAKKAIDDWLEQHTDWSTFRPFGQEAPLTH